MSHRKRKQINIEEKSHIISKLESGIPNKDIAKEYGVSHSTISTIWKEREKIQMLYDNNFLKMKRARTTKHTKVEEALLKWFTYQRTNNVPINGPILQQKANEFAQHFGEDFVCSSSWIQRFRARHGIVGGKMNGDISMDQLAHNSRPDLSTTEADEFIDIGNSIAICSPDTEDDIVREVKKEDDEQEDSEEQFTMPTLNDGLNAVSVLRKIVLFNEQFRFQGNYDDMLIKIQCELLNIYSRQKCSKQTKITDFMHTKNTKYE